MLKKINFTGEGDCNHDQDCEGSLICGNNNCNKKVKQYQHLKDGTFINYE